MKLHDAHIHVGHFRNAHFSSQEVYDFLKQIGVEKFAVSSTAVCAERYDIALQEISDIVKLDSNKVIPVLWLTPQMLTNGGLDLFLASNINWRCLKVHGYFHDWHTDLSLLEKACSLAQKMELPLLFHTGGRPESDAGRYMNTIKSYPNVKFILAHSRPVEQTLLILKECNNAFADTAFTPLDDVLKMVHKGYSNRIMFGTDYPLPKVFYPQQDMSTYYLNIVLELQKKMSPDDWDNISYKTFEKIFI